MLIKYLIIIYWEGNKVVWARTTFLSHINMQPPGLLFSLHSAHMFLFKASRPDYDDWCSHYPLPHNASSNGWLPKAVEGRPFLPTALLIFHRETLLFFQSFAPQSFPYSHQWIVLFPHFYFAFSASTLLHFRPWNYARCGLLPLQTILFPSFLLFWYLPMLLSPLLWPGNWLSFMATLSGRCSKVGSLCFDWSGEQESGFGPWRCTQCLVAVAKLAVEVVCVVPLQADG